MHKKGFTLLEMLTVVMIITILTAVAVPQYRRAIQKSKITGALAMLRVIYDSGERLAGEYGYRDLASVATDTDPSVSITFPRMDMFGDRAHSNVDFSCTVSATLIICADFVYGMDLANKYVYATKRFAPYINTQIRLNFSNDIPAFYCVGSEEACDLYGIDRIGGS